jgi:hypothetical protein
MFCFVRKITELYKEKMGLDVLIVVLNVVNLVIQSIFGSISKRWALHSGILISDTSQVKCMAGSG